MSKIRGSRTFSNRLKRRLLIGTSAFVILGVILITGCGGPSAAKSAGEGAKGPVKLPVLKPIRETVTRLIQQPAYIKAYEETPIYSKIAGFLDKEPNVDKGSWVKKGDMLVVLRVPEMEADLELKKAKVKQMEAQIVQAQETLSAAVANITTCEAQIVEAQANVAAADADCQRWKAEYDRGMVLVKKNVYDQGTLDESRNQWDQSKAGKQRAEAHVKSSEAMLLESKARRSKAAADIVAAEANRDAAKAERDFSKAMLDYREIKAPYDGVITQRNVHTDHLVEPASSGSTNRSAKPLFVIMRMDKMRITLQVPELDSKHVANGMKAKVALQAYSNEVIEGVVTRSSVALDENARTLLVEVELDNKDHRLRPGMYAYVTIEAQIPNAWAIPNEALVSDEGDQVFCYVIEKGHAVRTSLRTDVRTSDNKTIVLKKSLKSPNPNKPNPWEEFTGQELIVARNAASLIDGQEVEPVLETAEGSPAH